MAPTRFGPYELAHRLGAGGMAETFAAVRRGPGDFVQHVCVKRILPAFEADPTFVKGFLEEAKLAARLRHRNIAQVVDFGSVGGSHYLALELIDGVDLRALLASLRDRGARLPAPLVAYVGMELAAALDAAHRADRDRPPVVHRDVSPSNVLVSRAGEVYLTDFGIARALGPKRRTDSGVIRGKVPYMAPEYAMSGEFDTRTDLFGLGVVLYEALAGERPFQGRTELDTLTRIQEGRHPPLLERAPGVPPDLAATVERLIRPTPADRYASAAAVADALAPHAPPATAARELGALVREVGAPGDAARVDAPATESLPLDASGATERRRAAPPPSYPDVRPSDPAAETRTAGRVAEGAGPWSATDPSHVSHHDEPAPALLPIPRTKESLPAVSVATAEPARRGRPGLLWAALVAAGVALFVLAGAAAYLVVQALRSGAGS